MSPLLRIITLSQSVSIIMSLLHIITIITYYYVFWNRATCRCMACLTTLRLNTFIQSNNWTIIDKRTTYYQNCEQFQLQQQQKLSYQCDVLPRPKSDFSFADPAFGNIFKLLKVMHLYLCAFQPSVSCSLLNILQHFEQLVVHTTSTVPKYAI